jgi:calcium-dependent protein kinase
LENKGESKNPQIRIIDFGFA